MSPQPPRRRFARVNQTQIASLGGSGEELPGVHFTRQRAVALGVFVISAVGFLYFVLPKLAGLRQSWDRIWSRWRALPRHGSSQAREPAAWP